MKLPIMALAMAITFAATAMEKTPEIAAKISENFKEGSATKIFFYSTEKESLNLAGMCVGKDCQAQPNSVQNNKEISEEKKPYKFVAATNSHYELKADGLVNLLYTVAGNNSVYLRTFKVVNGTTQLHLEDAKIVTASAAPAQPDASATAAAAPASSNSQIRDVNHLVAVLQTYPDLYSGNYNWYTNNCSHFARRALARIRSWGLVAKMINVDRVYGWMGNGYQIMGHARIRVWFGNVCYDIEPYWGGQPPQNAPGATATEMPD